MDARTKFLRILDIEFEDLADHLESMVETYREREHRREVSERVSQANEALYRNEQRALRHFRRILDTVELREHPDVDTLTAWLSKRFDEELKKAGLSCAACCFSECKMQRVKRYVQHATKP